MTAKPNPHRIGLLEDSFLHPWFQKLRFKSPWSVLVFMVLTFCTNLALDQVFPHSYDASMAEWLALRTVMIVIGALCLFGILNLLSGIEYDLSTLSALLSPAPDMLPSLSRKACILTLLIGISAGVAIGMLIDGPKLFFTQWLGSSLVPSSLLVFIIAPMTALQHIAISKYAGWLDRAAETVEINFLHPDEYESFSNPFLRMFGLILLSLSTGPAVIIISDHYAQLGFFFLFLGLCLLPLLLAKLLMPMLTLRRKIVREKARELDLIYRYYKGADSALRELRISAIDQDIGLSDVMAYEARIREMWDIPIAPRYHKFLIVFLIPPTTWILAGVLENVLNL